MFFICVNMRTIHTIPGGEGGDIPPFWLLGKVQEVCLQRKAFCTSIRFLCWLKKHPTKDLVGGFWGLGWVVIELKHLTMGEYLLKI